MTRILHTGGRQALEAAVNFGKANIQKAVFKLSTGEEIRLERIHPRQSRRLDDL